jgi:hypothetical protein
MRTSILAVPIVLGLCLSPAARAEGTDECGQHAKAAAVAPGDAEKAIHVRIYYRCHSRLLKEQLARLIDIKLDLLVYLDLLEKQRRGELARIEAGTLNALAQWAEALLDSSKDPALLAWGSVRVENELRATDRLIKEIVRIENAIRDRVATGDFDGALAIPAR